MSRDCPKVKSARGKKIKAVPFKRTAEVRENVQIFGALKGGTQERRFGE